MHVPDVYRGEEKRLMVSTDVARSDMSRLINLEFIACFWPPTPSVTGATTFSKVALHILQLIFKGVNNFWVADNERVGQQSPIQYAQTSFTQSTLPQGSIDFHNSSRRPNLCDRRLAFSGSSELSLSHHLYWLIDSNITFKTIFISGSVKAITLKGMVFILSTVVNRETFFFAALVKDLRELKGWRQHK